MKFFFSVLLFVMSCVALPSFAQSVLGTFRIPRDCFSYEVCPDNRHVVYQTVDMLFSDSYRRPGTYGVYDMEKGKDLWSKSADYVFETVLPVCKGVLVSQRKKNNKLSACLCDMLTGYIVHEYPIGVVYANEDMDIVLGYKKHLDNTLYAYSLSRGERLWESKVACNPDELWNNVMLIDSTRLMFTSKYMYLLDLQDGSLQKQKINTCIQEKEKIRVVPVPLYGFGALGGALGGFVQGALLGASFSGKSVSHQGNRTNSLTSSNYHAIISLQSDILRDKDRFYHSDRKKLVCYDKALNVVWQCKLPRYAGMTDIHMFGDTILLVSNGYGVSGVNEREVATPFILAVDKRDGKAIDGIDAPVFCGITDMRELVYDSLYVFDSVSESFTFSPQSTAALRYFDEQGILHSISWDGSSGKTCPAGTVYKKGGSIKGYTLMYGVGHPSFRFVGSDGRIVGSFIDKYAYMGVVDGRIIARDKESKNVYVMSDSILSR